MKRQIPIVLLVFLCAQLSFAESIPDLADSDIFQPEVPAYQSGELIVRFADIEAGVQPPGGPIIVGPVRSRVIRDEISDFIVSGAVVKKELDGVAPGLAVVKLPEGTTVPQAFMQFNSSAQVKYAEPNYKYKLQVIPNDPLFDQQWALDNPGFPYGMGQADADIDANEAWDIQTGDSNIVVAVLDTGVDYTHPDLAGNMWVNDAEMTGFPGWDDDGNGFIDDIYGYDFVNLDSDPADDHFHGTHVAGIIGADTNNATGIAGVCWDVQIMALKVGSGGYGGVNLDAAVAAIGYARDHGAKVINASWGGYEYSQALKDAIDAIRSDGILFVAAAGNDYGNNNDFYPFYPAMIRTTSFQ